RELKPDADLVAYYMYAVLDNGGPQFLLQEAQEAWKKLNEEQQAQPRLRALRARCKIISGEQSGAREELESLAITPSAPLEAIISFAETLLEEHKVSHARLELRRALALEANHPRVLSMLAETYLRAGPHYSSEYGCQLATSACQSSGWLSAREMHILAEAYYHSGDCGSALVMAKKAKQAGGRLLGEYRNMRNLEALIDSLSSADTIQIKSRVL
ncbi:MAG: hypothetical protein KDD53_12860, partial [Bdellovibrionales bacterium]|nr:hypothetical protein [Bdellovibrionales bacterium]